MTDKSNKIAVAADHAGFRLKSRIAEHLREKGMDVIDLGVHSEDRADYPDYGYALARAITEDGVPRGVAVCGSGVGISMALNRDPGIRAAVCTSVEMAELARKHNDANVLALGERLTDEKTALSCVDAFLQTAFEGGRHAARVQKLGTPNLPCTPKKGCQP